MNHGTTWESLFTDQDVVSIGDVAIASNDAAVESINRIISSTLPAVYQALGQPQLAPGLSPFPAVTINIP